MRTVAEPAVQQKAAGNFDKAAAASNDDDAAYAAESILGHYDSVWFGTASSTKKTSSAATLEGPLRQVLSRGPSRDVTFPNAAAPPDKASSPVAMDDDNSIRRAWTHLRDPNSRVLEDWRRELGIPYLMLF